MKTLRMFAALVIGISVAFLGLSITLAFGLFAWLGMPVLIVGLGLLSAAVETIEDG